MSTFHFLTKPETLAYRAVRSYALITPGCSTVRFTVRYWAWTTFTAGSRLIGDAGGGSDLEQPHRANKQIPRTKFHPERKNQVPRTKFQMSRRAGCWAWGLVLGSWLLVLGNWFFLI